MEKLFGIIGVIITSYFSIKVLALRMPIGAFEIVAFFLGVFCMLIYSNLYWDRKKKERVEKFKQQ